VDCEDGRLHVQVLIDRASDLTLDQAIENRHAKVLHTERLSEDVWVFTYENGPYFEGAMRELTAIARVGTMCCEGHLRERKSGRDLAAGQTQLEAIGLSVSPR
jgi:hypothetical protein